MGILVVLVGGYELGAAGVMDATALIINAYIMKSMIEDNVENVEEYCLVG